MFCLFVFLFEAVSLCNPSSSGIKREGETEEEKEREEEGNKSLV